MQQSISMMESRPTALVVTDNEEILTSVCLLLEDSGFEIVGAIAAIQAMRLLPHHRFDVAIIDLGLPEVSGFDIAGKLRLHSRLTELLLIGITDCEGLERRRAVLEAGFKHCFFKPVDLEALGRAITSHAPSGPTSGWGMLLAGESAFGEC